VKLGTGDLYLDSGGRSGACLRGREVGFVASDPVLQLCQILGMSAMQHAMVDRELTSSAHPTRTAPLQLGSEVMTESIASEPTTARAPTISPVMQPVTTHTLARTHLIVIGSAGPRPWQPIDKTIAAGALESHLSFVSSCICNVRRHDLCFQCLVELGGVYKRLAFLFETITELMVLLFDYGMLCLHGLVEKSVIKSIRWNEKPLLCILSCRALICEFAS
jgi:hypothetical protein